MVVAFFAGILFLYLGSEALVRGGSSLALRLNIRPLIVGLTIIAISTSSPELVVSIKAVLINHGDISIGDVVGTSIFNVAGILSFCTLFGSIPLKKQIVKFDLPVMVLAYILLSIFLMIGKIPRWAGIFFVFLIIAYILALYFHPKLKHSKEKNVSDEITPPLKNIYLDLLFILAGLSILIYGGQLVVTSAIFFARLIGINEASIALSVVAIGTSLPEVSCCLVSLRKKKYDLLVGNIIGSNIFNIFSVIGIASTIRPIDKINIRFLDLGILFLTGTILFPFFQKKSDFSRIKGVSLILLYVAYILFLYIN